MQKVSIIEGLVAPLERSNVDTDAIIPKQFLKSISRSGFGPFLFDSWRYLDVGEPEQDCSQRPLRDDFVLNLPRYQGAQILLARENFGCGSSREHAVWALYEYGFRCVIAPSYGDIFYTNAGKNGLLTLALAMPEIEQLFSEVEQNEGYSLTVNLHEQAVITPAGVQFNFDIEPALKERLLLGLDDIGLTLEHSDLIRTYEQKRAQERPWLFPDLG